VLLLKRLTIRFEVETFRLQVWCLSYNIPGSSLLDSESYRRPKERRREARHRSVVSLQCAFPMLVIVRTSVGVVLPTLLDILRKVFPIFEMSSATCRQMSRRSASLFNAVSYDIPILSSLYSEACVVGQMTGVVILITWFRSGYIMLSSVTFG
jgi:hypothetical protein